MRALRRLQTTRQRRNALRVDLEEIGRRAVALVEARAAVRRDVGACELFEQPEPEGGFVGKMPCRLLLPTSEPSYYWCPLCQKAEQLQKDKARAGARLSAGIQNWLRQKGNKK